MARASPSKMYQGRFRNIGPEESSRIKSYFVVCDKITKLTLLVLANLSVETLILQKGKFPVPSPLRPGLSSFLISNA